MNAFGSSRGAARRGPGAALARAFVVAALAFGSVGVAGCGGTCSDVVLEFVFADVPPTTSVLDYTVTNDVGPRDFAVSLGTRVVNRRIRVNVPGYADRLQTLTIAATLVAADGSSLATGSATANGGGGACGVITVTVGGANADGGSDGADGAGGGGGADGGDGAGGGGPDASSDALPDGAVERTGDGRDTGSDSTGGCFAGKWTASTADSATPRASYQAMTLDSAGYVHVAYTADDPFGPQIRYATNKSGAWTLENAYALPSIVYGGESGIDVSPAGVVTIADADSGSNVLRMHTRSVAGTWSTVTADSTDGVKYTSLRSDPSGVLYASYYAGVSKQLRLATKTPFGAWSVSTVDFGSGGGGPEDVGKYSSIGIDTDGFLHISYYTADFGPLRYATNATGSWAVVQLDSLTDGGHLSSPTALAVDGTDVHICYYDYTNQDLIYIARLGGFWAASQVVDSVGDVGRWCSIGIDSSHRPAISYVDTTNGDVKFARATLGTWSREVADGAAPGSDTMAGVTSMAIDASGRVHLTYQDATLGNLRYATRCPD